MYSLAEVHLSGEAWDAAVQPFKTKSLFHQSAWLDYLEHSQNGRRLLLSIHNGDRLQGYFCGVLVQKGPFTILGSPLRGWMTVSMGPAVHSLDPAAFLTALDAFCRKRAIDYAEICSPVFDPDSMRAARFLPEEDITYLVPILSAEEMWQRLKSECRNRIRKGQKNGLRVEVAGDPQVMEEFFAQVQAVFAHQGFRFHHSRQMIKALWDHLHPRGQLLTLRVFHGSKCIATGIFPFDDRAIYFWGGASWPDTYRLCPNELVHWTAMTFAAERGIPLYDMCGGGSFKPKFGGTETPRLRWHKAYSVTARLARQAYKAYWFGRRDLLRRVRRLARQSKPEEA